MQAGFKADQVDVNGRYNDFSRISDESDEREHVFHFCPECGSQVFYTEPDEPDLIVVSVGSFADPTFPPPTQSGYDSSRHPWVGLPDSVLRQTPEAWEPARLLYDEGRYAEAADRGREAMAAYPDNPGLALQRRVLREPRRPRARGARLPPAGDRAVERVPRIGQARLGLRPDPRGTGVRRARRRVIRGSKGQGRCQTHARKRDGIMTGACPRQSSRAGGYARRRSHVASVMPVRPEEERTMKANISIALAVVAIGAVAAGAQAAVRPQATHASALLARVNVAASEFKFVLNKKTAKRGVVDLQGHERRQGLPRLPDLRTEDENALSRPVRDAPSHLPAEGPLSVQVHRAGHAVAGMKGVFTIT